MTSETISSTTADVPSVASVGDTNIDILFITGSPRKRASVLLAELLMQGAEKAGATVHHFYLYQKHIDPCVGCGDCGKTGVCILANRMRDGKPADDYLELKQILDSVDAVGIVAPLYFAGPTSQFKAVMDRFQPYYAQRYLLGITPKPKRPAHLYVVGAGGDPHGYDPLVGITRSAFNVAGFTMEKIHDFVGFLSTQDAAALYAELDTDAPATAELVRLRRLIANQEEFEARAIAAGAAFARYVVKQQEASALAAQLDLLKAEMEELKAVGDRPATRMAEGSVREAIDSRDAIQLEYMNLIRRGRQSASEEDVDLTANDVEKNESSDAIESDACV
jgi:multimeric flavodoxin WrbA